jgi:hypothetical protein
MSESTLVMDRAFSEVRRLCYAGLDEEALLREAAERTRSAVSLDQYCMHAIDPSSGLVTRGCSRMRDMGRWRGSRWNGSSSRTR